MSLYGLIGQRIREARMAKGYSQDELGKLMGYTGTAISYFETGVRKVKVEDLKRLSEILLKPIDHFLATESADATVSLSLRAKEELHPAAYEPIKLLVDHLQRKRIGTGRRKQFDYSGYRPWEVAQHLLREKPVAQLPVPVKEIAEWLGIPVVEWDFSDEVSAVLIQSDRLAAIGVNGAHAQVRKRFSVAHELGHYLLRHDSDIFIEFAQVDLAAPDQSADQERHEREANWFAADLLMPADMVREDFKQFGDKIEFLSKRYQVSEQALWFRLKNLRLIEPVLT